MSALNEQVVVVLRELVEGRMEPSAWLAWWTANSAAIETMLPRATFLALKPRGVDSGSANAAALGNQSGACKALDQLHVSYQCSDRYRARWLQDIHQLRDAETEGAAARVAEFTSRVAAIEAHFPLFGKFLRSNSARMREMSNPASAEDMIAIQAHLGFDLPEAYVRLLRCVRTLAVGDTLRLALTHPFIHRSKSPQTQTDGMLCIADFWIEADGDQALIDVTTHTGADPPVLYYAHESTGSKVRKIADRFTDWIESLPRTLAKS
jgi:hypothetical protein